jgi:anti-sigma factor RsiW
MNRYLNDTDYELLSAYIDGELSAAERRMLEKRLTAEPQLQTELESMRQLKAALDALPLMAAPRDFTLNASMVQPAPAGRVLRWVSNPLFSAMSAAAAVFMLIFGSLLLTSFPEMQPAPAAFDVAVAPTFAAPAATPETGGNHARSAYQNRAT